MRRFLVGAAFFALCTATVVAQEADTATGRILALKICAACHVVMPAQESPPSFKGPLQPPSFQDIADKPTTTAQTLQVFLSSTHSSIKLSGTMPSPELNARETRDIISFILSLRARP